MNNSKKDVNRVKFIEIVLKQWEEIKFKNNKIYISNMY